MERLLHYFPDLSAQQREQFAALGPLYNEWNARVNLISRNDIVHLYERHVLHSLGVAMALEGATQDRSALKGLSLRAQSRSDLKFIDVGTGGGFPGVPLAILYPQCTFHMIDGIGKKIAAVKGVIEGLGLTNATAEQVRSEDHRQKYDVIVSRAVTTLPEFIRATKHLVPHPQPLSKGEGSRILYLKGGELADEILPVKQPVRVHELASVFQEEFFATKKVVEVAL
ncbi:MAG: 16S rRNA (guanine(527)-N(7))-methyltransferase RsmG [Flavobacteriales bacterium]|nr:MAG: 16S rRNA (guanine(527)-N(7))-methyltransferase RsmG [Flavobacteriales bacterium]